MATVNFNEQGVLERLEGINDLLRKIYGPVGEAQSLEAFYRCMGSQDDPCYALLANGVLERFCEAFEALDHALISLLPVVRARLVEVDASHTPSAAALDAVSGDVQ